MGRQAEQYQRERKTRSQGPASGLEARTLYQ